MRRPTQILLLALAILGPGASAVAAAGGLTVGINESRRVLLTGDAATVVVGDPKVADVAMMDSHSVIVMGRGYGTTQLFITDHDGHVLMAREVTVPDIGHVTLFRGVQASEYGCGGGPCQLLSESRPSAAAGPGFGRGPAVASGDQEDMTITMHRSAVSGASPAL